MDSPVSIPRLGGLKFTLVAGLALLTTDALFAQSAGQSDVDALKAQMNQMQQTYEQRIEAMEAKMKAIEANANSGSILNTRILTDADGKEGPGKAPAPLLDESFLKSLTRNFSLAVYVRAGVAFNGSGGGQGNTTFQMPDAYVGGGRSTSRLGNENDFYFELSLQQAHILGDSPDVADTSFRVTLQMDSSPQRQNALNTGDPGTSTGMDEAYVEMKNVLKSAPEITFWAGDRFYDRYNIDSEDYFWLNTSGFGAGVYNIPAGPGTLWLAWLGSNEDNLNTAGTLTQFNQDSHVGNLYKQTLDLRYHDVDIGFGKLTFVLIGNYIKGDTYETTQNGVTGIVRTSDAYGIGGGAIWTYDFGNKSELRISGLYGHGATDFYSNIGNQIGQINTAFDNQIFRADHGLSNSVGTLNGLPFVQTNAVNNATEALATAYFVWNPVDCFSLGFWVNWEYNDNQSVQAGLNSKGDIVFSGGSHNLVTVGVRPVYWVADNIAIQGAAAFCYNDNVRVDTGSNANGSNNAFGKSGQYGIFTIAPTIKAKGGFFTRPELRLFATYSIWSDSLKGSGITSGGGGSGLPPYANAKDGWLIGSQMEIWF
jgi:maltoporin